jgi:hypothetical protein
LKKDTLEIEVENDYCDWLRDEYPYMAIALKLVLFIGGGFPDRTILSRGRIFFIEFKRPGRPLDPLQRLWRRRLKRLGFKFYVCTTVDQAKRKTFKSMEGA